MPPPSPSIPFGHESSERSVAPILLPFVLCETVRVAVLTLLPGTRLTILGEYSRLRPSKLEFISFISPLIVDLVGDFALNFDS